MECIKYATLMYILCSRHSVFGDCTLDRNAYNKYPFVLKFVVDHDMLCHGALITPKFFVAPYDPLKDITDLTALDVIGSLFGDSGLLCSDTRHPTYLTRAADGSRQLNSMVGSLATGFEVTTNNPYLVDRLEDYDAALMKKKFQNALAFQCCLMPVFKDASPNAEIAERELTYIGTEGVTKDYWTKVFCKHFYERRKTENEDDYDEDTTGKCHDDTMEYYVFVYDPDNSTKQFYSHRGGMLVCDGSPMAAFARMQFVE